MKWWVWLVLVPSIVVVLAVEDRQHHRTYRPDDDHRRHRHRHRDGPRLRHQRHHRRQGTGQTQAASSWVPDWASPILTGNMDLGETFSVRWDFNSMFEDDWWKGVNVCKRKEEEEEDLDNHEIAHHHVYSSSNCDMSDTAYRCTTTMVAFGKKKTVTIVYECCHGYQKEPGSRGCTKELDLKDVVETAREMGGNDFVGALQGVGLDQVILDNNYTIFVPTNDAFKDYKPKQAMAFNVVVVNAETTGLAEHMRQMLLSHLVSGFVTTSGVQDEMLLPTNNPDTSIRINMYDVPKRLLTANCIPVISTDNQATNGVVHVIDGVLQPTEDSIVDIVASNQQLSYFKTMLGKLGVASMLKEKGQYTLLAPTDGAFRKMQPSLLSKLMEGNKCLDNLVRTHILPNVICSSVIQGRVRTLNILNSHINMTRTDDMKVFINHASLVKADVMAVNGVVHIIDDVLIPDNALDILDVGEKIGAREFLNLVAAGGLTRMMQSMDNFTIFLPTDEAVKSMPDEVRRELIANPVALESFIKYHIVPSGEYSSHYMRSGQHLQTMEGDHKLFVKDYYSTPFGLKHSKTVQCARIITRNQEACNGVAHLIDSVLVPPKGDVLDTLSHSSNFTQIIRLLKKAGLAEELQKVGPFTLFAPTNKAFAAVDQQLLNSLEQDINKLKNLLKYHIIRGHLCCSGVFSSSWLFKQREWSLEGSLLSVTRDDGHVVVNQETTVNQCDMTATNGVVHAIDNIVPEAWSRFTRGLPRRVAEVEGPTRQDDGDEDDGGMLEHVQLHRYISQNWDKAWERMRDWDWLNSGWDRSRRGQK